MTIIIITIITTTMVTMLKLLVIISQNPSKILSSLSTDLPMTDLMPSEKEMAIAIPQVNQVQLLYHQIVNVCAHVGILSLLNQ